MSGFIEFSLNKSWKQRDNGHWDWDPAVICFAEQRLAKEAVEITGDKMPETWHENYKWEDLNIMLEAYVERYRGRPDLRNLMTFIRAFGFSPHSKLYMHVWESRLDKPKKTDTIKTMITNQNDCGFTFRILRNKYSQDGSWQQGRVWQTVEWHRPYDGPEYKCRCVYSNGRYECWQFNDVNINIDDWVIEPVTMVPFDRVNLQLNATLVVDKE